MIRYRQYFARIVESWFAVPADTSRADILRCYQLPEPIGPAATAFDTIQIDLRESPEALFAKFKKDTRNEIRRAEREQLSAAFPACDSTTLREFGDFYDRFAAKRGIAPYRRNHVEALAAAGVLRLSRINAVSSKALVWHAYVVAHGRARLLLSASESGAERTLVGRANRLLHWRDMQQIREDGLSLYDLGGWYGGTDDVARARIDRFKAEFGGLVVREYNSEVALTVRGRAFRWLQQRRYSARQRK